jgi:hypothetical protein
MRKLFKNIKTTLFGAIAGLPTIIEGVQINDVTQILLGIGTFLIGLFAKDSNTTEQ